MIAAVILQFERMVISIAGAAEIDDLPAKNPSLP